eukprot:TRINITY_DN11863_c0_g1_i1.p1 TRINITY_DN11863_c0_g1~~TRINITY_DN11863_c0_g1_i1.p1  ORF type:complete len:322 (-),score=58.86 TRINITY_DN11863_c0_g1_i1:57-1022(-)
MDNSGKEPSTKKHKALPRGARRKNAIVTGATAGIGFETAKELYQLGFNVIMACRNMKKCAQVRDRIQHEVEEESGMSHNIEYGKPDLQCVHLDLASLLSVRKFSQKIIKNGKSLDVLINNAGALVLGKKQSTRDGFELQFQVNYLSHFLLTILLLPAMLATQSSRIVNVSSAAHKSVAKYDEDTPEKGGRHAYAFSKLCQILFTKKLKRKIDELQVEIPRKYRVKVNAMHPGLVYTNLFSKLPYFLGVLCYPLSFFGTSPKEAAATAVYLAASSDITQSGEYFQDGELSEAIELTDDEAIQDQLWDQSIRLVQQQEPKQDQ